MVPAAQRFEPEYRSGAKVHLRLKVTNKLIRINRVAQIRFGPGSHVSQARPRPEEKILCRRRKRPDLGKGRRYVPRGFAPGMPIFSAILTSSGSDRAPIFLVSWERWTLTVASLASIKAA